MKTSISRYLSILPLAGLSLVAPMCFSCSPEVEISVPQPTAPETAFVVSAAARPQSDIRAIVEGGIDDNLVNEITILLFDATSNFYVRSAGVATVTRAGTSPTEWLWRFSMSVPAGDYKALFLANAAEIVAAKYDLAEGKEVGSGKSMKTLSIEQVALSLARAFGEGEKYNAEPTDTAGGYAPFVMSSGQVTFSLPLASPDHFSNNPVKLSRDVAKINVEFASAGARARAQLEISEIRLCNYNTRSCAVGTPALWTAWNGGEFTDPLFAAYAARPAGTVVTGSAGLVYGAATINSEGECVDEIFSPERPFADNDNLCLLVNGDVTLGGRQYADRWFKIDFIRERGGVKKHVNILRNYSYTVTIGAVGNPGYGSPEEAYSHNAEGIVTDIDATTPEEGLNDIVYNGEYMLAVDRSTLTFTPDEGTRYVRVFTDYSGGWQVRGIDWSGGETDWFIPGMNGTVSPNAAGASSIVEIWRLADNTTGTPRTATVILAAGNLTKRITVTETL